MSLEKSDMPQYNYSDLIGAGPEMQHVFYMLSQVSITQSTVLIMGETGTGKELIARAIHNASPRRNKLMVKVNCATLPPNLIESELFGHERGSFTGALERRIGKFELANHSTLFLDEIGELPPDLQVKLLRAIQEKEIERIGGKHTIKTDVRIIAATNRNLQKEVAESRFRSDLFYRLNVFPIVLPPLRERKEDIPLLAAHFIDRFARTAGKKNVRLSSMVMKQLNAYNWPGNVRELEHVLERSILLMQGNIIREIHLSSPLSKAENKSKADEDYSRTLAEVEREYILGVLDKCRGKVFGPGGAAEILGLHVSTLNHRIRKLGIHKEHKYFIKVPQH
ncbi:sigma-54 interaction domain-containing protein [Chitinophaga filiformis]|uniref:Regulatory protein, Fis family n=1 Tax=Chitinophaga filiformis TaxID=104663 RepID=A0A1G7TSZ0_CHIFI|nr:sigma 54-interacting transcriptional regulator [Chitinophaga filiformis]SDG38322.1 regulatory protein, Fis family [Chitinophaga filiformis]